MKKQTDFSQDRRFNKFRSPMTRKRSPTAADGQVGESIRAHRLIAGMSQTDLAQKLGVSFQQVQKYEKGTNRVGAGRLPLIAGIFNIPISALFKDHAETSPGKGKASTAPVRLITDPNVLKLLAAYGDITDRTMRRRLAELVERIAKSAKKKSRR
jgi:transcriptional regulator with XRE-family HTH domain